MSTRKVPVYFDSSISLREIMTLANSIGCTLRGNARGELIITRTQVETHNNPPPSNVIPLRGLK